MKNRIDLSAPLTKLQLIQKCKPSFKNPIKISKSKLPNDFFIKQQTGFRSSQLISRNNIQTQCINRVNTVCLNELNPNQIVRKQAMTSRNTRMQNHSNNLIQGVISISKQMKKMIRRHSLQFKKTNNPLIITKIQQKFNSKNPQLPTFLNKDFRIQKSYFNTLKTE